MVKEELGKLIEEELGRAILKGHSVSFNSAHEGWAVAKEEMEEFEEQWNTAKYMFEEQLWSAVRHDDGELFANALKEIKERLEKAFDEFVQFTAMIDKMGGR